MIALTSGKTAAHRAKKPARLTEHLRQMNDDYRSQFAKAVIADMREALEDPEITTADHVTRHGAAASFNEDGTLEVGAAYGVAPAFVRVNAATMRARGPAPSPSVVWMRIRTEAHAVMHMTDDAG